MGDPCTEQAETMTKAKDLKRRVRARMAKTGESYTAARAHLVGTRPAPLPRNHAALAGVKNATLREKTGHTWGGWTRTLDDLGATEMTHREIAKWLSGRLDSWWAQTVTVGYERLRGLREVGQSCEGDFQISKSATLPIGVAGARKAWSEAARSEWLEVELAPRKTRSASSLRFDADDGTRVSLWFTSKGRSKCSMSLQVERLASGEAREAAREAWSGHLASLRGWLATRSS